MTSPIKVIWEECVATPYGREYTRPFRVLPAAQCPLQTCPIQITQPRIRYIHPAVSHASYMPIRYISYTVLSDSHPSPKNKI